MPDVGFDSQPAQHTTSPLAVLPGVCVHLPGMSTRLSRVATNLREVGNRGQDLFVIARVGRGRTNDQWHDIAINQQREFRARFPAIYGAGLRFLATTKGANLSRVDDRSLQMQLLFVVQQAQ